MVAIVTYDLHNPGRSYEKIEQVLTLAGGWAHPQGSVWLIDTLLSVTELRDRLKSAGDTNDEFFVARLVSNDWASSNTDQAVLNWLHSSSRRW